MKQTIEQFLTTRALARMWMVSEATVKRWADAGLLRASRTAGGHRRFLLDEVARFQTERGLGQSAQTPSRPAGAPPGRGKSRRGGGVPSEQLFDAITGGQDDAAASLLLESYLDGVPMWRLFDEAVAGAMRRVGDLWHEGGVTVADEHYATRTAVRAIERLGVSVRRRLGPGLSAICCAPEGELHDVPALCLQVMLESEGWRVVNLGANTPLFTLADAIKRHRPQLVCVSSTILLDIERGAREYAQVLDAARASGARLALGGRGFADEFIRRRFPAELHGGSFGELAEFTKESA